MRIIVIKLHVSFAKSSSEWIMSSRAFVPFHSISPTSQGWYEWLMGQFACKGPTWSLASSLQKASRSLCLLVLLQHSSSISFAGSPSSSPSLWLPRAQVSAFTLDLCKMPSQVAHLGQTCGFHNHKDPNSSLPPNLSLNSRCRYAPWTCPPGMPKLKCNFIPSSPSSKQSSK
jgi:hypothetical protein